MNNTLRLYVMSPIGIVLESYHKKRKSLALRFDVTHINSSSQMYYMLIFKTIVLRHTVWYRDNDEVRRFMILFVEFQRDVNLVFMFITRIRTIVYRYDGKDTFS